MVRKERATRTAMIVSMRAKSVNGEVDVVPVAIAAIMRSFHVHRYIRGNNRQSAEEARSSLGYGDVGR